MILNNGVFAYATRQGRKYGVRLKIAGKLWQRQGFPTKQSACAFRDKIKVDRFTQRFFPESYSRTVTPILLPEPVQADASRRARHRYVTEVCFWKFWTKALHGERSLSHIQAVMDQTALGPATKNRYCAWLRKTLKIPVPHWPEPKAPPYYYTREQEQALYAQLSQRDRDICRLTMLCLLRRSEVFSIRKEWIDWENGKILLPDPKAKEPQWIHVPAEGMQILRRLCNSSTTTVIVGGRPDSWYKSVFRPAVQRAGLSSCMTFHTLRHTGPGRLAAAGVPDRIVQQLGRWKTASVVGRYTHHADADLKAAAEKLAQV